MDDAKDDTRYPVNARVVNHQQPGYGSSSTQKLPLPIRNPQFSRAVNATDDGEDDDDNDDDDDDDEEMGEDDNVGMNQNNGVIVVCNDMDDEDDDEDDDSSDDDDTDGDQSAGGGGDSERRAKKRKMKSLVSSYEFAPRVPPPSEVAPPAPKPPFGGRNPLTDWTEHETFVLLDAWGERFLQRGRKSLRSDEWQEVAEKVSEVSKIERSDTQCRNRLDTLKKKYKKEKMKPGGISSTANKWVYFKKMDVLMVSPPQQTGLSCGLDSGEYIFMNPRVYLNRANGMDEMRDSPGNSEFSNKDGEESDGLPPKKRKSRRESVDGSSFKLLADSIQKFSDIYEKVENSKRQQIAELEKMRMDFHRDMDFQRRQIMEGAQAEITKIRQDVEEEEHDHSDSWFNPTGLAQLVKARVSV